MKWGEGGGVYKIKEIMEQKLFLVARYIVESF